jgi:hypothetical protein
MYALDSLLPVNEIYIVVVYLVDTLQVYPSALTCVVNMDSRK